MSIHCPYCRLCSEDDRHLPTPIKIGYFRRHCDQRFLQRFKCAACRKSFSLATFDKCFRQRKRTVNFKLRNLLASGCSQRRAAFLLNINRKTVVRKFLFLGQFAMAQMNFQKFDPSTPKYIQFDELETFEHTKCKPLSVLLAIEEKTRRILYFDVARMPAKGLLAKKSFKKYGWRPDERGPSREFVFRNLNLIALKDTRIKTDKNPHYVNDIKRYLPSFKHETTKGQRGAITGQGELKKIGFDPLFSLNHTCAMFRANINRLCRKTWCTTKKPDRLLLHIAIYAVFHNTVLIRK